ncbi:hypothetical protein [Undibacterium sp. Di24W]|uniref:hypothetical protein n=1 Tax=Undibacterium sp. Di24W TaxID=3413033 RepID=UPI003BF32EB3
MSAMPEQKIYEVAAALTRLRGETLSSLSFATDVKTANLSVWLRGREQVISEKRVAAIMHHLGLKAKSLRDDMIHKWTALGSIKDIKTVFEFCLSSAQKQQTLILQGDESGLASHYILQIPNGENAVYIVVALEPTPSEVPVLTPTSIKFGTLVRYKYSLQSLPTKEEELKLAVSSLCEEATYNLPKHVDGTEGLAELFEADSIDQNSAVLRDEHAEGFSKLKIELSRILNSGVSPNELASKLSTLYVRDAGLPPIS